VVISELNTWPVCTPVNVSPASFRTQTHDSEPKWCATPFLCGSLIRYSLPVYPGAFLNHFVRPRQYIRRDCKADLLGGLQIDDELKLLRLFYGEIGGLGALEDLIHINSRPSVGVVKSAP
jgi:hypothetical protein